MFSMAMMQTSGIEMDRQTLYLTLYRHNQISHQYNKSARCHTHQSGDETTVYGCSAKSETRDGNIQLSSTIVAYVHIWNAFTQWKYRQASNKQNARPPPPVS
eukprot:scaffold13453_cov18-Prasinocladus_malaysianus.AAC.1